MNLPNCDQFCTVDKCLELEQKIAELQFQLDGLLLLVNEHISQDIPTAHNYESNLSLSGSFQSEILTLTVADGNSQDSTEITIPSNKSNLSINGSFQSEILTLTVADGESQDSTEITIPLPEVPEYQESNLSINGSFESEILTLTVADGESQDSTQITIPLPEIPEYQESNLSINGSYHDGTLTVVVSDGESTSAFTVDIPRYGGGGGQEHIPSNLSGTATYESNILTISIADGESQTAFQTEILTMDIVGWKNEDKETLIEILKKTLISAEIVKAALFHPYQPGGSVAGDAVTESVQQQQETDDQNWSEFVNRVNNPAGRYNVPKPKAKIKDLSVDSNP